MQGEIYATTSIPHHIRTKKGWVSKVFVCLEFSRIILVAKVLLKFPLAASPHLWKLKDYLAWSPYFVRLYLHFILSHANSYSDIFMWEYSHEQGIQGYGCNPLTLPYMELHTLLQILQIKLFKLSMASQKDNEIPVLGIFSLHRNFKEPVS